MSLTGSSADLALVFETQVESVFLSGRWIDDFLVDDVSECLGFALALG